MQFKRDLSVQNKVTYNHRPIVNIYVVYRLSPHTSSNTGFTLKECLFGTVELTKSADVDKYKYSGYGIGFDSRGTFTYPSDDYGVTVIIFGCDLKSSVHANNRKNNILILRRSLAQDLNGTTLYAERMYPVNFTATNKTLCLSLRYSGDSSYLFVNSKEIISFKAEESENVPYP